MSVFFEMAEGQVFFFCLFVCFAKQLFCKVLLNSVGLFLCE